MVIVSLFLLWLSVAWGGGGYDTNHPDVKWQTLYTKHFAFHWPSSRLDPSDPHYFTTEFTVRRLSEIAEKSYDPICRQLNYYPVERTHVVIYDQDVGWEGNGFALAEVDWTGFAADWGPLFRVRGRMEFLSDVFVHEFAHIVSLKAYLPWSEASTGFEIGGLSEDEEWLRRWGIIKKPRTTANFDIGFNAIFSAHAPFWWAEGGAEYWSHNAGYNFWGESREAFLRTTFLENRQLTLDEWTTVADKTGFDGERGYNQGYDFGLYLQRRFGFDVMSKMAQVSAKRWRVNWDDVVYEATGVSMETLYADWVQYNQKRFASQAAAVRSKGLISGRELSLTEPPWELQKGEAKDDFEALSRKAQEEWMDGETAYQEFPRYSPNGEYLAWFENGLNIIKMKPQQWGALSGKYFDEVEDSKQIKQLWKNSYNNDWIRGYPVQWSPDGKQIIAVGSEDWTHRFLMDQGLQFNADGYNWNQLLVGTLGEKKSKITVSWKPLPNTLRAVEGAWRKDGKQIAFVRYGDGTHNLWTISPDGSNPKQLTRFADGTQIQGVNWLSHNQLIMALFREHRQNLWIFDLTTQQWTQLTGNRYDETDPFLAADGRLYFTSNFSGIHNVFSMNLSDHAVQQHTNVLGSAYGVDVTTRGDILYTDFTGHGFRIKALTADAKGKLPVSYPGLCHRSESACTTTQQKISEKAPEPEITGKSKPYRALKAQQPFNIWPVMRSTDKNVESGTSFFMGDFVEKHALEGQATFGKDNYAYINYWNDQFWPTLSFGLSRYSYKGDYGYGIDLDDDPETPEMRVVDIKFEQLAEDAWVSVSYIPSYALWVGLMSDVSRYSFRETGDGTTWSPYQLSMGLGGYLEWSPSGGYYAGDDWINPRGSRRLYVDYSYRRSAIIDPELSGGVYDDGEFMEDYGYHRILLNWTEFVPVPYTTHHTLQLDVDVGYIDRNVMGWDEFMAGGRHPYNWGNGTIGNNIQFSGFEGFSLSGETMLIANLAYRFPLARDLNKKLGPFYFDSFYMQFFGSAGNLWSYRVEGPSHLEGYSVVPSAGGKVRREVPFVDYASKNSPLGEPHYVLNDIGFELRSRALIWNDWDWDSFLRFAYGLQSIGGYGDVDADLIQSSQARDAATELSSEIERPTIRVYLGLGTGW